MTQWFDRGHSVLPDYIRGRMLRNREYGCGLFGFSVFGEEPVILPYAKTKSVEITGIYQTQYRGGKPFIRLLHYFVPQNPRTETQQNNRQKYSDSIIAWRNLTNEQKQVYNKNAVGMKMTGYNLFQKEYMLSH